MKKTFFSVIIAFVLFATTLFSIPIRSEASRNEYYMDRENARNFIAFICNARTSKLSDDFFENNKFYHLLVGDLADNPMLEYNVKSEFLGYALTQIDEYIQKSGSAASETRDNLVEFFSEKYVGEIQGLATSPIEETVSWGLGVIWKYGPEVADSLSTLVSFAQDPDKFTDDLKMIMNGITYLYASEVNKVYTYFDTALSWADNNDVVYEEAMNSNKSMMILSGDYDGSNLAVLIPGMDRWTDWVEPIKYWAKYVYNMSCEVISGPPIYTITYITNSPFDGDYSVTYDTNESPNYPELYRDGYAFGGWFTDASCTKSASQSARSNQTWYAKWTPLYEFNISNGEVTITKFKYYKVIDDIPITNIVLPDYIDGYPVTKIGENAFKNITDLTGVTLSKNVICIEDAAFAACPELKFINFNQKLTTIGYSAFSNCSNLTSISLPESLTTIRPNAFRGTKLTSITIPKNVSTIGRRPNDGTPINGCDPFGSSTLSSIYVDPENRCFSSENGILFNKNKTTLIRYPVAKSGTTYTIPNTVSQIGEKAFSENGFLNQVFMRNNVTKMGDYAFSSCTSLETMTLSDNITEVSDCAFMDCCSLKTIYGKNIKRVYYQSFMNTGLTTLPFSDSLVRIDDKAFAKSQLKEVHIPPSVMFVGSFAFTECMSLETVVLSCEITDEEYLYDSSLCWCMLGNCFNLKTLTISDNVEALPTLFMKCTSLETINIGKKLKTFPDGIDSLSSINLKTINVDEDNPYFVAEGKMVLSKDKSILYKYPALAPGKRLKIPSCVSTIEPYAFYNIQNLETVFLDKNTYVKTYSFNMNMILEQTCSSLKKVYYSGSQADWETLIDPNAGEDLFNAEKFYNCRYFSETTAITYDGKTTTAYIIPKEEYKGKTIVFATYDYDTNKLTYSDKAVFNGSEIQFTTESKYDEIKIFVWDSLKGLTPSCKAEVISAKDW